MVTPIQETPSLTLSESDMQVATEDNEEPTENGHVVDPLLHRYTSLTMQNYMVIFCRVKLILSEESPCGKVQKVVSVRAGAGR